MNAWMLTNVLPAVNAWTLTNVLPAANAKPSIEHLQLMNAERFRKSELRIYSNDERCNARREVQHNLVNKRGAAVRKICPHLLQRSIHLTIRYYGILNKYYLIIRVSDLPEL